MIYVGGHSNILLKGRVDLHNKKIQRTEKNTPLIKSLDFRTNYEFQTLWDQFKLSIKGLLDEVIKSINLIPIMHFLVFILFSYKSLCKYSYGEYKNK
jgi:hypothetical protein